MIMLNRIKNKLEDYRKMKTVCHDFPEVCKTFSPPKEDAVHLNAAMNWLCFAQKNSGTAGVASLYNIYKKEWGKPYRETTGYIIPTFLNYSKIQNDKKYEEKAFQMGNWLLEEQMPDGSYGEEPKNNKGALIKKVFNTGQIILGLCSLNDHTGEKKYIEAADKAAHWLLTIQEENGSWEKFTTAGPRTYHSRVAWPLLEVFNRTRETNFKKAAIKNIGWVIAQQKENGWFQNCSLSHPNKPWTHLIAYTIRGLLESAKILKSEEIFSSAIKPAERILDYYKDNFEKHPLLAGTFDRDWRTNDKWSCLTGNMQIAIIWLKLSVVTRDFKFKEGSIALIESTKETQVLNSHYQEINGGIAGSHPINGDYAKFTILNWATKFFADALMLKTAEETIIKTY